MKRIGLLSGHEPSLVEELCARLSGEPGVEAEAVVIGGTAERHIGRYDVILDRLSHLVPHYRAYLKAAALAGTTVVNDPFRWSAGDKFFALSLAARLGLRVPRTVLLPHKQYGPRVIPEQHLGNLQYPLDWGSIAGYVELPAVLRAADGSDRGGTLVRDFEGLMGAFDASGEALTMLQHHVSGALHLRVVCVGERAAILRYDPQRRAYVIHDDDYWLPAPLREQALGDATRLARALGFDLCAVEMVVKDGAGFITDAQNPVPDLHREAVGERHFELCVGWLCELLVSAARSPRRTVDRQPFAAAIGRG